MKICIFGAGAVAGLAAARMARIGTENLSVVARGDHLATIRKNGLTVRDRDGEWTVPIDATDDTASLGPQDIVIMGLKAHTVSAALDQIAPLIGPDTAVVHTVNGIPWWYFHALPGNRPAPYLDTVDPGGRIAAALGREKAVGCVVYVGANVPEPGVVEHNNGGTYIVGEPDGSRSARAQSVVDLLVHSGLEGVLSTDIRREVWTKLWGNLSGNPMSVLCKANCEQLGQDEDVCRIMADMMTEAGQVAAASGCDITPDVDERLDTFRQLGTIKTSMLQDFEAGKAIELDALLGVIGELGRRGGVETPTCDMIYALTRLKAQAAGCYEPPA